MAKRMVWGGFLWAEQGLPGYREEAGPGGGACEDLRVCLRQIWSERDEHGHVSAKKKASSEKERKTLRVCGGRRCHAPSERVEGRRRNC